MHPTWYAFGTVCRDRAAEDSPISGSRTSGSGLPVQAVESFPPRIAGAWGGVHLGRLLNHERRTIQRCSSLGNQSIVRKRFRPLREARPAVRSFTTTVTAFLPSEPPANRRFANGRTFTLGRPKPMPEEPPNLNGC